MPTLMLSVESTEDEQQTLKAAYAEQLASWKALEQQYLADRRVFEKAHEKHQVDDAKALSILVQCVSDAHMHIFEKPGITAQGAWLALKSLMEPSSMMRMFMLFQNLFRDLKFVDGKDNLGDFINHAQSLFTQMSPLFPNMDRSLLVWAVLCALPARLHPTRDVILSHKASTMTAEQAFQLLMGADQVQRSQGGSSRSASEHQAVAFAVTFKGNCHNCQKYGHRAAQCPEPKRDDRKRMSGKAMSVSAWSAAAEEEAQVADSGYASSVLATSFDVSKLSSDFMRYA